MVIIHLQRVYALLLMMALWQPMSLEAQAPRQHKKMAQKKKRRSPVKKRVQKKPQQKNKRPGKRSQKTATTAKEDVVEFSKTICKFFANDELDAIKNSGSKEILWQKTNVKPFSELILSWNAFRPLSGYFTIWVSVLYEKKWSKWHRLAQWGAKTQKTFLNKMHPHVHTKHCRVDLQQGHLARGFRAKIVCHKGAQPDLVKAMFACVSRLNQHKIVFPADSLVSAGKHHSGMLKNQYTKISQFMLDHPRKGDICSPVSTAMMVGYFHRQLYGTKPHPSMSTYAMDFTKKVHDQGYLNIFGNWILNTAHAFHAVNGEVYFSVQRLNSFYDLHHYLSHHVPVVVSVRRLLGGATPYAGGHLLMVVGYDAQGKEVVTLDPAFATHSATFKKYPLRAFIRAWGRSNNLSYVPFTKKMVDTMLKEVVTAGSCLARRFDEPLVGPLLQQLEPLPLPPSVPCGETV
jgi:hypothetical protein